MPPTADVIVIGAGVLGPSIALELARGERSVVIVDKGSAPGHGSTSASSAIVRFNYSTSTGVAAAWEAKHCWQDWTGHLGVTDPAGLARYVRTGGLVIGAPDYDHGRVAKLFADVGIPCQLLDAIGLRRAFPYLSTGRFHPPKPVDDEEFYADPSGEVDAFHTPEGGFVDDPALAAHNLHHAASAHGVRTHFRRRVVGIVRSGGRVRGVTLDDGTTIDGPVVVNAAGPHSAAVNALAGVTEDFRVTTRPLRQEVFVVPGLAAYSLERPSPFVADVDLGIYFRPDLGGGVLVGGMEPECDPMIWVDDPDAFDVAPSLTTYVAQTTRLARRMPALTVPLRPRGVVGLYDVTPDWIPIYDRTALDGYYVAIGTSGNQFKNAPVVGQLMRCLIDACENGHDHDRSPLTWTGPRTGLVVDLAHYSRLREPNPQSTNTVLA
jgi:glycine/D-amino acid oxidase-like deaminating enzyme